MRLIDADALKGDFREWLSEKSDYRTIPQIIDGASTIDAEPVRHGETTSYISTDDIDKYKSRIILDEGEKSKWCRVFYEDDRQHGVWLDTPIGVIKCSECGCSFNLVGMFTHYCPNCGAKMDGGAK